MTKRIKINQEGDYATTLCTQMLDMQSLTKHPNQLIRLLSNIHPTQKDPQQLKIVALMAYCHPVMTKQVQEWIAKFIPKQGLWKVSQNLLTLLQVINILCLVKGFNYTILNLNVAPSCSPNTYQQALWLNCLKTLTDNQYFQDCESLCSKVSKDNNKRVVEFINSLKQFKKKVKDRQENEERETEQKPFYHELDLQTAEKGFVTIDYFPTNYSGEYIEIWIDKTVQLNSLLGNFVCKQKFGEFQYIRGPLIFAMEKGILLVLNNLAQISNELLISIKSLSLDHKITHNQKHIKANAGFKIVGILPNDQKLKAKAIINRLVFHYQLPARDFYKSLPIISNQLNYQAIMQLMQNNERKLGFLGLHKFWKRIVSARCKEVGLTDDEEKKINMVQIADKLWNTYFTQQFLDSIQLELNDLTNEPNINRIISYEQKYKRICIGRCDIRIESCASTKIVSTQYSLGVLEKLSVCFEMEQYPLLVSETGCGKTTLVQYLAQIKGHKLYVYNMSSGTDVSDLIGGFKPIDCRILLKEIFFTFIEKFRLEVKGANKNQNYLTTLINYYQSGKIQTLLKSLVQSIPKILNQLEDQSRSSLFEWKEMERRLGNILANLDRIDSNLVFTFLEGNLIKAIKNGDWILIDEINLATNDVLQKIVPLIQGKSLMLYEKGDLNYIQRHPDFRIVACMNPANDSGKKPLPPNLSQMFTTIVMSEPSKADVEMMTKQLCPQINENDVSSIYFQIKKNNTISLRNLTRALAYINKNKDIYGWNRSLYDGLMLGFSHKQLLAPFFNQTVPKVPLGYLEIQGFLLKQGTHKQEAKQVFHLTQTFKNHLKDFLRAISGTDLPVLLEGPTSAGKTSMIRYVAQTAGYKCIRINNHEHTEIEQYIGNYFADRSGKLVFREGPLVQAVREGHWLILDELNLAKTQILECLNRLLDDNRQLFIPEQQKHIKPHQDFRIFATQNPSSYSGRKSLSRAFRNRFVSISFVDITIEDTIAILEARSPLLKHSKELSNFVKKTLQTLSNYRQRQRVFEKDGLITIRNLLKWSQRPFFTKEKFAIEGYAILAEKLRNNQEKKLVENVILSPLKLTLEQMQVEYRSIVEKQLLFDQKQTNIYVQMNDSFKRMAALTCKAIKNKQPVLLIGETGCGKTTLAELLAVVTKRKFFSINCHKHMEASDLLGSLRPCVNPNSKAKFEFVNGVVIEAMLEGGILLIDEINTAEDSVLERLNQVLESGEIGIERGEGWETINAKEGFCIIATMNPSGDYGKKELSPALRNRFTQIWVEPITHPEYIKLAKDDILQMIWHKLQVQVTLKQEVCKNIYDFVVFYNCEVAQRYNLQRKLLTMRDIGWICQFINRASFSDWQQRYFWGLRILAIQGINYLMSDSVESNKLQNMKNQLVCFIQNQIALKYVIDSSPLTLIQILKDMDFPLLIKTDQPIQLLGLEPQHQIFFSPQTDLSDLLGQYRPVGNDFVWQDEPLLRSVKEGGMIALIDLNMAQQQVVEGINSLFDHRGSLFVVQLNQTFHKASTFKPVIVLRSEGKGRKGLPNSFLNRFVKLSIKDVNVNVKISYLTKKYPTLANFGQLIQILSNIITTTNTPIHHLELITELGLKGHWREALQILNLSQFKIQKQQILCSQSIQEIQQDILQLLPLPALYCLNNSPAVEAIIKLYLILKKSKFSLCLVGKSEIRSKLVEALQYLLKKKAVKILVSTMIDINDLLGSYQQVTLQSEMQPQPSLQQTLFCPSAHLDFISQKTKFAFIPSKIVKSLQKEANLLYIEVPNERIGERVEKGLRDVYERKKQIVIGIDETQNIKDIFSKIITVDVSAIDLSETLQELKQYFVDNHTHLNHNDRSIRQDETEDLILDQINQQNDRKSIAGWRRLLQSLSENNMKNEEINSLQLKQRIENEFRKRYNINYIFDKTREQVTEVTIRHITSAINQEELNRKILLHCFFSTDLADLNKKITLATNNEEQLMRIIAKFQILYLCNLNQFQKTALTIMPVLFSLKQPIIHKYYLQIERLYQQLLKDKVNEVLIQFNEQQYKMFPILNNPSAIKYQMITAADQNVLALTDLSPHLHHIANKIEKPILKSVQKISIDFGKISNWILNLKIKQIGELELIQDSIKNKDCLYENILNCHQIKSFLNQLQLSDKVNSAEDGFQKGILLFNFFKPCKQMSLNIGYHLKNELNLKYYTQLIGDDEQFLKKYKRLIDIKYGKYEPNKYKISQKKIQNYQQEIVKIQKFIIYRRHDNIENLIQFYKLLIIETQKLEESQFQQSQVANIIVNLYKTYYHIYNDILAPYFLGLIAIYEYKITKSKDIVCLSIPMLEKDRQDPLQMLYSFIQCEDEAIDKSKEYIKLQKKFNRTVIVDEYTEEGVAKNKERIEEQFKELFGKQSDIQRGKSQSPFEKIHMLISKTKQNYYPYLSKKILYKASNYEQMVLGMNVMMKYDQEDINIYEEYNPIIIKELVSPLPAILYSIHQLIIKYQTDNIKQLANLCSKIQQHSIYSEIYKILVDCEFLIEKIFEVNSILPMANHIDISLLIQNCLRIRKLELRNWKQMIDLKTRRIQKSDMIEFMELFKQLGQIKSSKQLFAVCQKFLRESKLSCINNRINLLYFLHTQKIISHASDYEATFFRLIGFYQYLKPDLNGYQLKINKQKCQEMREYEKLAGWNSHQYLIFKATCEKFQRKIHYILRRYEEETSITIGSLHQQFQAQQLYNSTRQLNNGLLNQLGLNEINEQEQDSDYNKEDSVDKKQNSQKNEKLIGKDDQLTINNDYEKISNRIFVSLKQLQEDHHNSQSKLLVIRYHLSQLEAVFQNYQTIAQVDYQYLTRDMFEDQLEFKRATKYYYGLWDKLCQRAEAKWNRQILDRLWGVTEKIWVQINLAIKSGCIKTINPINQDIKILFEKFIDRNQLHHPIFDKQVKYIKIYLQQQAKSEIITVNQNIRVTKEIQSLIKLGYILSSITLNLQKNGLCVKEQNQQNQGSGTEQVGDGMGIGEGQAHDAAQNVGDEIQFEEQVQGHKDEQQNEDRNANNKEQNDIQMEGDFNGQMYSKEEDENGDSEQDGKSVSAQEKMGDVDEQKKEADMKNEEGEASGNDQADVDVKNQKQGDEELIDNERQQKEQRKAGEQGQISGQEQEQEKSDWEDNNDQGDKINEQNEDVEAHDKQENSLYQMEQEGDVQSLDDSGSQECQNGSKAQNMEEEEEKEIEEMENQELENGSQMQGQNDNLIDEEQPEQHPKRPQQQKRKYDPAYGRKDFNTNNEVLNQEQLQQKEMERGNEGGNGEGQQGSGNPVHNLSAQLLQQIIKEHRSEGKQQFMKDLNVVMHDEDEESNHQENAQQFELTNEKNNKATNLPFMDDQQPNRHQGQDRMEKQEQKQEVEQKRNKQKQKKQEKKGQKTKQEKKQKKDERGKNGENQQQKGDEQNINSANENLKKENIGEKQKREIDLQKEQLIKQTVSAIKIQNNKNHQSKQQHKQDLVGEAFDLSKILEEQLKSVLEPMDNAEYRGDFKTGKKLNLKKIIPFIASNYRKDRIWLRRTEPTQRNYYIMIGLDDTKSMHHGEVGEQALKGLLAITMALDHLSVKNSICSIRDQMTVLKKFEQPLSSQKVLQHFQFTYESSNSHDLSMASFMRSSLETFIKIQDADANVEAKKLCFIISDGKMNKKLVHPYMREAKKNDITYVFIIVDSQQSSILSIKTVQQIDGKIRMKSYMSDFPFDYFLIIKDAKELGEILALTLMQFIQQK